MINNRSPQPECFTAGPAFVDRYIFIRGYFFVEKSILGWKLRRLDRYGRQCRWIEMVLDTWDNASVTEYTYDVKWYALKRHVLKTCELLNVRYGINQPVLPEYLTINPEQYIAESKFNII